MARGRRPDFDRDGLTRAPPLGLTLPTEGVFARIAYDISSRSLSGDLASPLPASGDDRTQ